MLKGFFSRREMEPLYVEIPSRSSSETDEKPAVPTIVLTPSTPTEFEPRYPAGRLPAPNARWYFCDDGEADKLEYDAQGQYDDPTLKPVSRWPRLNFGLSSRSARLVGLLVVVGTIALVHFSVLRMSATGDDDELATE